MCNYAPNIAHNGGPRDVELLNLDIKVIFYES